MKEFYAVIEGRFELRGTVKAESLGAAREMLRDSALDTVIEHFSLDDIDVLEVKELREGDPDPAIQPPNNVTPFRKRE